MNSVSVINDNNLCCSCGICKNVCPTKAIEYTRQNGMFVPSVNGDCINCGKCLEICPSRLHKYDNESIDEAMLGCVLTSMNAWSKNDALRFVSASSGVVSTIIKSMLDKDEYDCVFTLDTYNYADKIATKRYDKSTYAIDNTEKQSFTKSRYLPVSHEYLIEYMLGNKESKIIIVAVSCAVRGIVNVINKYKLNRENYLIIGLFCDQVFNYNVYDYFSDHTFTERKMLSSLHFKNKESGGWPGDVKLLFSDGSFKYADIDERVKAKAFFMPERCMYCVDKLNVFADISVGDNYTDQNSTKLGSNSVIIRTELGKNAFETAKEFLEYEAVDINKIANAQYLEGRKKNYSFAQIKLKNVSDDGIKLNSHLNSNLRCKDSLNEYKAKTKCIKLGEAYPTSKEILKTKINQPVKIKKASIFYRTKRFLKRRFDNEG